MDANGSKEWDKPYGGAGTDDAYYLLQTADGEYALAGRTDSYGAGSYDFWLVKTDADGNKEWDKTYGGTDDDGATSILQTADGGYVLAGYTRSFGAGNYDMWLVKTDADGNKEWDKTYGGTGTDDAYSLLQIDDSGYAVAGRTASYGAGSHDFWLVKTDANGNKEWDKTYGGTEFDSAYSLLQTADGGYVLAGNTESFGAGGSDIWLVKYNYNQDESTSGFLLGLSLCCLSLVIYFKKKHQRS
jgi:hypothetical protein